MTQSQNRFVLITGASRGIGKAAALLLAQEGTHLYLTGKTHYHELEAWAEELSERYGIFCQPFLCDMGDPLAVEQLFSQIKRLDVLINNAGITWSGPLQEMAIEEWEQLMHTNLDAVFYACKFAIPLLLQAENAKIINLSSVFGSIGASCEVAYSASKGGINAFTRALAKELAPSGIAVNAIAPGVIDTDMNRNLLSPKELSALQEEIPSGRFGTAKEVAQVIHQLMHAPSYLTGQILTIDGGWQ